MRLNLSALVFFAFHPKFLGCELVNAQNMQAGYGTLHTQSCWVVQNPKPTTVHARYNRSAYKRLSDITGGNLTQVWSM